ncbi:MAG: hypothetical protein WBY47_09710 [Desulfobacterales bacterium]
MKRFYETPTGEPAGVNEQKTNRQAAKNSDLRKETMSKQFTEAFMHHIHINPIKNRMYVILKDGNTHDRAEYVNTIENACGDLADSFSCVAVFDKKGSVRQNDLDLLFNTVDLIYAYGAGRIVLVRKNNASSDFFQQNLFNLKACFMVENASDIQEAEDKLDRE